MDARGLHLRQEVDRPHRRRHVKQLADDVGLAERQRQVDGAQIEAGREWFLAPGLAGVTDARLHGHERQQVADVHDAFGVVEGFIVDDKPRMRRALERAHQFAERDVAFDRDDIGTMHHHVGDAPLVQAEDIAQHGALDGGEADLVGRRRIEHDLQIVADRSRLPAEQRADGAGQPVVGGRRTQHFAFLHDRRQVARVARIVVGGIGVRHVSPSGPHRGRECLAARESPARGFPWLRRRSLSRDRSRSDAGSHAPQDG